MIIPPDNSNIFTRLGDGIIDFDNPNRDTTNIPAHDTQLSSVSGIGRKGMVLTQSTGANQAIFKRNEINGHHAALFSGNQFFSAANAANNQYSTSMTLIAIVKTTSLTSLGRIFTKSNGSDGFSFGRSTDKVDLTARAVREYISDITTYVNNEWCVVGATYAANSNGTTTVSFYKNRDMQSTLTTLGNRITASTGTIYLGSLSGTQEFWSGYIQLFFWAWRTVTTGELNILLDTACKRILL